jgi:hypothetical protein
MPTLRIEVPMRSILMSSPGRCGHHWVADVLGDLTPLKKIKTRRFEDFELVPEGAIMLTHDPLINFKDLIEEGYKAVIVVRDPRDVVVSAAHYWMSKPPADHVVLQRFWGVDEIPEDMDLEKMLALLRARGHNPAWWNAYTAYGKDMPHHLVRYEDMWHNPLRTMCSVLDYLECSASHRDIEWAFLRQYDRRFRSKGRHRGDEDVADHYRKGIIGDWKNYFTEEENHWFCEYWRDVMDLLGYEE